MSVEKPADFDKQAVPQEEVLRRTQRARELMSGEEINRSARALGEREPTIHIDQSKFDEVGLPRERTTQAPDA